MSIYTRNDGLIKSGELNKGEVILALGLLFGRWLRKYCNVTFYNVLQKNLYKHQRLSSLKNAVIVVKGLLQNLTLILTDPPNEVLSKAEQHKNMLLEFDRTSEQRTKVIDDESDYFSMESNQWLTPQQRKSLQKRAEEINQVALL
jgi:activating signal cointegrator 1